MNRKLNSKVNNKVGDQKSNNRKRIRDDDSQTRGEEQQECLEIVNSRNAVKPTELMNEKHQFTRGMKEKEINVILFLLEGEPGFERMTLREKMTECVKRATQEIQEWFYTNGVEGTLANNWAEFKKELVVYCSERGR